MGNIVGANDRIDLRLAIPALGLRDDLGKFIYGFAKLLDVSAAVACFILIQGGVIRFLGIKAFGMQPGLAA